MTNHVNTRKFTPQIKWSRFWSHGHTIPIIVGTLYFRKFEKQVLSESVGLRRTLY